jgi:hypothetical protein
VIDPHFLWLEHELAWQSRHGAPGGS